MLSYIETKQLSRRFMFLNVHLTIIKSFSLSIEAPLSK